MSKYEEEIINSWNENAHAWSRAIQNKEIESRNLITNKAILDIIIDKKPKGFLDIGCGEGWLETALSCYELIFYGIDVIPKLIEEAKKTGNGNFEVLSYKDLSEASFP